MRRKFTQTPEELRESVYQAVKSYIEEHSYAPTIREINKMTGISSTCTVHRYLQMLIDTGRIETDAKPNECLSRVIRISGYKLVKGDSIREREEEKTCM